MIPEFHRKSDGGLPGIRNQFAVLSAVLKVTNQVTPGEV
jgi:hypothetical protein